MVNLLNIIIVSSFLILNFLQCYVYAYKLLSRGNITNQQNDIMYLMQNGDDENPKSCFSEIWCYGELLHTVQMKEVFEDSKHFVDMKLKKSAAITLEDFNNFMIDHNNEPTKRDVENFVKEHFDEKGSEFTNWIPDDWTPYPRFLDTIRNPELKQWGLELHELWKQLGRKMIDDVQNNPDLYSIIYVKNPLIVPGGRFIEFYYWDSFWILKGLLHSQMLHTARGMLENFLSLIERFQFIPNGGRIYYLNRSQPPLLASMIKTYVEFTGDDKFAIKAVKTLEKEFNFFMKNRTITVSGHRLAIWINKSSGPRPESYREDYINGQSIKNETEREEFYRQLKAAAESGMDFTSRFFYAQNESDFGKLTDIKTSYIVPVELNAYLYWNAKIIAEFYFLSGNISKSAEFEKAAISIKTAIDSVLWDNDVGVWLDYDLIRNKRKNKFVATNLAPLWVKCFNIENSEEISQKILNYINSTGIVEYPGGIPNTLSHSGEQWDFPNAWPPMEYIIITGLENLNTIEAKLLAKKLATNWVQSNYEAYLKEHSMYEKYNAEVFGGTGGGGEYNVQTGFGWSNGVILDLLVRYGDSLVPARTGNNTNNSGNTIKTNLFATLLINLIILKLYSIYK